MYIHSYWKYEDSLKTQNSEITIISVVASGTMKFTPKAGFTLWERANDARVSP